MKRARYTTEQYEQAKQTSLVDFLTSQGFSFLRQGYYWRCNEHDSLVVKENGRWYWNSKKLSGYSTIDYLVKVNNMSPYDAIMSLCDCDCKLMGLAFCRLTVLI